MAGMLRNMATSVTVKRTRVHRLLVLHLESSHYSYTLFPNLSNDYIQTSW